MGKLFKSKDEFDLTSGGIATPLAYLALPIVVTNLLQTAYNLADTVWLGWYSTEALAAISFAFPMVFLAISLGMGITVAGSVLVAQNIGAENQSEADFVASQTIGYALLSGVVFGIAGYFVVGDIIHLFGASPSVHGPATRYMQVISLGLFSMFGFATFIALLRGAGNTLAPMKVMLGTVGLNIVIDPLFIFGVGPLPEMGVTGAAIATILSRILALGIGLYLLVRGSHGVTITATDMIPSPAYARRLVTIGGPATIEVISRSISINLMMIVVGLFPTTTVAAYGIGARVLSVIFLPAVGIARAVETMTGQNIGAKEYSRVEKTNQFAAKWMAIVLSIIGVFAWMVAPQIIGIFTTNEAVVKQGTDFLRYVALTFGGIGVLRVVIGGFRGASETLVAAFISLLTFGIIRLPIAWYGADSLGPKSIWISFAVSNVIGATLAYILFRSGLWRRRLNLDEA